MDNNTPDDQVIIKLANCMVTAANCLGHTKTAENNILVDDYKKELKKRGVEIPSDKELYKIGTFNGIGSW